MHHLRPIDFLACRNPGDQVVHPALRVQYPELETRCEEKLRRSTVDALKSADWKIVVQPVRLLHQVHADADEVSIEVVHNLLGAQHVPVQISTEPAVWRTDGEEHRLILPACFRKGDFTVWIPIHPLTRSLLEEISGFSRESIGRRGWQFANHKVHPH